MGVDGSCLAAAASGFCPPSHPNTEHTEWFVVQGKIEVAEPIFLPNRGDGQGLRAFWSDGELCVWMDVAYGRFRGHHQRGEVPT